MTTVREHPLYTIQKNPAGQQDGVDVYDWTDANGEESDSWFETSEEAERDIRGILGLTEDTIVLTKAEYDELLDYKFKYEGLTK